MKLITRILKNRYQLAVVCLCLWSCLAVLLSDHAVANSRDLNVRLSWFINMEQYQASAHGEIFCVQCHSSIEEKSIHPDPVSVTREPGEFFQMSSCGKSNCHENTLSDYEKGVHGRIRFQNREKYANCIDCHDPHTTAAPDTGQPPKRGRYLCQSNLHKTAQPDECEADRACLACHSMPADEPDTPGRESTLCFHCHDQEGPFAGQGAVSHMPVIDHASYQETIHADNRCTDCHTQSAASGHDKTVKSCRQCHPPHDEAPIHDAHLSVDCEACHLEGDATLEPATGRIRWQPRPSRKPPVTIHRLLSTKKPDNCIRCHSPNNTVKAAAMVLPAKSIICASCHTATFSASDPVTLVTLAGVILVFLGLFTIWTSASPIPESNQPAAKTLFILRATLAAIFSRKIVLILKALFLDAILQRKLFIQSRFRWFSHGLIFYPFLLRFCWGCSTLLVSLFFPEWEISRMLLDKNHPLVAFIFDLTGVLVIAGVLLTMIRRLMTQKHRWPGLPSQEWLSLALMGGVIGVGFLLEGLRIAMTSDHSGQQFAFFGYAISLLFNNMEQATEVYGYVWYLHAILTGTFIVWLPFSRMFHIVMGPVAIAINAARDHK